MSTRQARGLPGPEELARVAWHISTRSEKNGGQWVEAGPLADGTGRGRGPAQPPPRRRQPPGPDQLCGRCGDGNLAVASDGTVWPCVMAR